MTKAKTGFEEMIERLMRDLEEEYRYASPEDERTGNPSRKAVPTEKGPQLLNIKEAVHYLRVSVRHGATDEK